MMPDSNTIPTIPMSGILVDVSKPSEQAIQEAREALLSAFETTGIAYLHFDGKTRPVYDKAIKPAFQGAKTFFSRPLSEKETAIPPVLPPGVTRGYLGTATESGADKLELKEAFSWSAESSDVSQKSSNSFEAPNVWPRDSENMKVAFNDLLNFFKYVIHGLCDVLSESLELPLREVAEAGDTISLLRAFHYHPLETRFPAATGSCAHTDWGFATLVAQQPDSEPALQADISGWITVPPRDGTLIVNASDFLAMISKGRVKSPLHRVILTERERLSFVYFHYPGYDTIMPDTEVNGISLLKNQAVDNGGKVEFRGRRFGEVIAEKWGQVARQEFMITGQR